MINLGMPAEAEAQLEALLDAHGLQKLAYSLQHVANAKADHIRENWQDEPLARRWEGAARYVGTLWGRLEAQRERYGWRLL